MAFFNLYQHFIPLAKLSKSTWDLWPLRYLIRVMRKHDLANILIIVFDNFNTFNKSWQFKHFFWQFWNKITIDNLLDFFYNFYNCWKLDNWGEFLRLETFETLITILTIENLSAWQPEFGTWSQMGPKYQNGPKKVPILPPKSHISDSTFRGT